MITIICGLTGRGKTALATNFAIEKMLDSSEDYRNSMLEIKKLNAGGFVNLTTPPQRHLVYADYEIKVNSRIHSYYVDGYELAIPNIYFKTAFLPPYSTIILDEAQKYYDSRMSKYLREEVYRFYQLHRHNHYNIILTCQRLGNIDLNIRALADKIIVCNDIEMKEDDYGNCDNFKWKIKEFTSVEVAERYCLSAELNEVKNYGKDNIVKSKFPIFNFYNSYANKPVFYKYNEQRNYDYYTEDGYVMTLQSFVKYNDNHYFVAPQGFWKNADYDKKTLKKYGEAV